MTKNILWTGLTQCYDVQGTAVSCQNSGQDAAFSPGMPWPKPRFTHLDEHLVQDNLTQLIWPAQANFFEFPLTWMEALASIHKMNNEKHHGRNDWRMPNRRELRSLISHGAKQPALPNDHLFETIFLGWYWTSTTSAMAKGYAWYIHMEGGRMFYGKKDSFCLLLPVCGQPTHLPATGQKICYDVQGEEIPCTNTGQDGELKKGAIWPEPRFERNKHGVSDLLTGCIWSNQAGIGPKTTTWAEALQTAANMAQDTGKPWRLPTINELESLVDCSNHSPALPANHPFTGVQEAYWSSTTSFFETDWSYVLYLHKGAVGVGYKRKRNFACWPVLNE